MTCHHGNTCVGTGKEGLLRKGGGGMFDVDLQKCHVSCSDVCSFQVDQGPILGKTLV